MAEENTNYKTTNVYWSYLKQTLKVNGCRLQSLQKTIACVKGKEGSIKKKICDAYVEEQEEGEGGKTKEKILKILEEN